MVNLVFPSLRLNSRCYKSLSLLLCEFFNLFRHFNFASLIAFFCQQNIVHEKTNFVCLPSRKTAIVVNDVHRALVPLNIGAAELTRKRSIDDTNLGIGLSAKLL